MKSGENQLRVIWARWRRLNYRHVIPDLILMTLSLYASLLLRLSWNEAMSFLPVLNKHLALFLLLRFGTLVAFGVYDIIWRYVSLADVVRIVKAVFFSSIFALAASYIVDIGRLPRAVFFIDAVLVASALIGVRFTRRLLHESRFGKDKPRHSRPTLIFGAGDNGRALVNRFATDRGDEFKVLGFVDDDPRKVGRIIAGVKVLGTRHDLPALLRHYAVQEVIVSIHQPVGDVLREVVQSCKPHQIQPRLIGSLAALRGSGRVQALREIGLNDLLSRPRRELDTGSIRNLVHNRRVLITGAGGSIGSELARQIQSYGPSLLLLMDHSEYNLYQIDHELRAYSTENSLMIPLLADVKQQDVLKNIFSEYRPEIVFHAAAYKHVHLVESNPYPSILNNVEGTRNLLRLSIAHNVSAFVLISTDKAVNPGGVMGATKRVCELLVASAGNLTGKPYCAVRFGNVLGSSGSLIPLLKTQIEKGEALTITHQDMTRYFMLIPEAVSLVLRAATIASPGDITILRMGEPVRIVDIAKSLIALMGRTEEEVPIVFTGIRPGEKLFEELYLCGNEIKTEDPDILILPKGDSGLGLSDESYKLIEEAVEQLIVLAHRSDKRSVILMNTLVKPAELGNLRIDPTTLNERPTEQ